MARIPPSISREKPLHWVGSAKKNYLAFPAEVQDDMGYALGLAQLGATHPNARPWKGEGRRGGYMKLSKIIAATLTGQSIP